MELRTIGWSIAVAVIATFGFVAMFAIEAETSSRDLSNATSELNQAKRDLESSESAREKMKERVAEAKKLAGDKTGATSELAKIESAVTAATRTRDELKKLWEAERAAYEASVNGVRRKMIGTKYPQVEATGHTLEDATLKSVADGLVTFEHSAGLTKLSSDKLPPALAGTLLPDWNPKLKLAETPAPRPAPASSRDKPVSANDADSEPSPLSAPSPNGAGNAANPHTATASEDDRTRRIAIGTS